MRRVLELRDMMIDTYFNHFEKKILISHFKHGTSLLTDTLKNNGRWIFHKTNIENLGYEPIEDAIQAMSPRYEDYKKYMTWRPVDESFISAFCYEMRTGLSNFVVDETQTAEEYENILRAWIELAGGPDKVMNRFLTKTIHRNGTFMSIFYPVLNHDTAFNLVDHIDQIILLPNLKKFLTDHDTTPPEGISNQTKKQILDITERVFNDLGMLDLLAKLTPETYKYKELLRQKPLYDTP